ncbi:MAG: TonB C-terminal domain-containing protein [Methylacidiphilales bacterium]|nr:TonB C-terminal domain-containing protein [Candidatus Methylacidiphilales bacterium]
MSDYNYDEEDDRTFLEKYGVILGLAVVVLLLASGGIVAYFLTGPAKAPKKPEEIMVKLLPPPLPPPPPPPPPKVPPPPEQKMVEQPKVKPDEQKPKEAKNDHPPGPSGPKASGPPSDEGIGGTGGGDGTIGGDGSGSSRWGWYAGEVQSAIADALRKNDKTRTAVIHLKVRVWADRSGRITRAKISGSSGDPAVDNALQSEVLTGLSLPEAPPTDMPMPIVLRISAQRPD